MKIADFGLARDVHDIDYYKKTSNVSVGAREGSGSRQRWRTGLRSACPCRAACQ